MRVAGNGASPPPSLRVPKRITDVCRLEFLRRQQDIDLSMSFDAREVRYDDAAIDQVVLDSASIEMIEVNEQLTIEIDSI